METPRERPFSSVHDDMEKLFGDNPLGRKAPQVAREDALGLPALAQAPSAPPRRKRFAGGMVAAGVAVFGVAGLTALGLSMNRPDARAPDPGISAARPQPPTAPRQAAVEDVAIARPAGEAPVSVEQAPSAEGSSSEPTNFATPIEEQDATAKPAPVRTKTRSPGRARLRAAVREVDAQEAAARDRRDCAASGEDIALCRYREVLAADRRLVSAYNEAIDAGVPTSELRVIRREWARARRVAEDDPDYTLDSYEGLATDLRAAARDAPAADE